VVLPENSPLLDKAQWSPTTASVLIKHRGSAPPLTEDEVKSLVARGVEGLQPENVAVVFKRINVTPAPNRDVGWYLSDAYVVAGSLTLSVLMSVGALFLVVRIRRQTATISKLRREIEGLRQPQQSAVEAARV
jgi:type III secretory pathway lipoprotein EscJ